MSTDTIASYIRPEATTAAVRPATTTGMVAAVIVSFVGASPSRLGTPIELRPSEWDALIAMRDQPPPDIERLRALLRGA